MTGTLGLPEPRLVDFAVDRQPPGRRPPSRALTITLLVSLGLHGIAVLVALLLLHANVPVAAAPEKPAEVELVMEERKGDAQPAAPPANPSPPRDADQKATAAEPQPAPTKPPVEASPDIPRQTTAPEEASAPAPATPPPAPPVEATPAPAEPAAAHPAPTISLRGTDSPSDARAWGTHIIPAAPDAVFHNRPPEYPVEAVVNGEHGTVVVVVHVSPAGTTSGVDVLRSSGYVLLDRAVREAVLRWRFLPAVDAGQPVPSDMTMGFVFDNR